VAVLLSARDLSHAFGAAPLFSGIGFSVSEGDRIGLIGPNGAGKSTLLQILAGVFPPDRGELMRKGGLTAAYLPQVPELVGKTVHEAAAAPVNGRTPDELSVDAWLSRFELDPDASVEHLSGGTRKRVALANVLACDPELLLLDEPTNHLDIDSILWLEELLTGARFATITITHDRLFLQRVSKRILELDRRNPDGLLDVVGDYATFVERKAETMLAQERREQSLRNTLRRETEWLRRGPPARSTKQEARIARAGAMAEEVADLGTKTRSNSVGLDFQTNDPSQSRSKRLIEAKGISKKFGDRTVFRDLDVLITRSTRLGLLGPNGSGKSTLLRVLTGRDEPTSGELYRADGLRVAYFQQNRERLDPRRTVAQTVCPDGDHVIFRGTSQHRNGYLERFLFKSEQAVQPVSSLSGGEQSRLLIACLMLEPADLLVLDEPTNDLDLPTLTILEEALAAFDGAVLLVTHDRYFLDQATTQILAFHTRPDEVGRVTPLHGLSQWETWHKTQAPPRVAKGASQKTAGEGKRKKLSFKDQRDWDSLEARILEAETVLSALEAEGARPEVASSASKSIELHEKMANARAEIDRLYARWAEIEALLAE
jgi:ABC transport system ATP-binding/permease protein